MLQSVIDAVAKVAAGHGWPFPNFGAVVEVESSGMPFAQVDARPLFEDAAPGKDEPLIRWEAHYFDRLLPADLRSRARAVRLAHPDAGHISNPTGQQERYDRLLKPAAEFDRTAALASCSWGMGQVMGANWRDLGFLSIEAFVALARSGIIGQLELMSRFIHANNIEDELVRSNWPGFARVYNGPNYRQQGYDQNLARAERHWLERAPGIDATTMTTIEARPVLKMGARGLWVTTLQQALIGKGAKIKADGDFGPATKAAVQAFQKEQELGADGIVGKLTWKALA